MSQEETFQSTGEALVVMARRKGWNTAADFARHSGIHAQTARDYFNGKLWPTGLRTINKLATALGVTAQWLEGHVQRDLAAQEGRPS